MGTANPPGAPSEEVSAWYVQAMERLVQVVQALSQARDITSIQTIVRKAARELTGADGATFVLRDGDKCYYADEDAIAPLWKGKRFPLETCISGWAMVNRQSVVIEDIYQDDRIPADAYRPTFVKSLAMVPIRHNNPIGAIGNYWAEQHLPPQEVVRVLQALADTTSVAIENVQLYNDLLHNLNTMKAQAARIQNQHEALAVFTRALAHDLKEPTRAIKAFSDLIVSEGARPDYVSFISTAAGRMNVLLDKVFQYTQLDDPGLRRADPVDLAPLVAAIGRTLNLRKRFSMQCDPMPIVTSDAEHMRLLFTAVIENAVVHNADAPKGAAPVTITVKAREMADHWHFSVSDTGKGVALDSLQAIFEPFKRLDDEADGVGIGLALARRIVMATGGRIWADSKAGEGLNVHFTLPKAGPRADVETEPPISVAAMVQSPQTARLMLVDDLESDITLARILLVSRPGMECRLSVARDSRDALKQLRKAHEDGDPIDLMLLDINMPGVDGFGLLELLRNEDAFRALPVIMCTGSTYFRDQDRAAALGVSGYLNKPPAFDIFRPMVENVSSLCLRQRDKGVTLLRAI